MQKLLVISIQGIDETSNAIEFNKLNNYEHRIVPENRLVSIEDIELLVRSGYELKANIKYNIEFVHKSKLDKGGLK